MHLADEFYGSANFWTATGVLVALLVGAATVLITHRVGTAGKRIDIGIRKVTALVRAPAGVEADLELRHRGRVVAAPQIVEIALSNRGRRDITRNDFDNNSPIRLGVGASVIAVLQSSSSSSHNPPQPLTTDDSTLRFGPALIKRGQYISYSVLVDGPEIALTCDAPLVDVKIRELRSADSPHTRAFHARQVLYMGLFVGIISLVQWVGSQI
ncbi:hypothetical protein ACFWNR_37520 [Streptomyces virginiae]|uniref:hypothetical protein n=1 Tax=Streptomyces virginiae TaxID=1961 RepID=UPI00364CF059